MLRLRPDSWVSYDADDLDADEREENDTVDVGGEWRGRGMVVGSILATLVAAECPAP